METQLTPDDSIRIQRGIWEKYCKVAVNPEGLFNYPTGLAGLEALNYDAALVESLPEVITASYCGVGNPFSLGRINQSEAVLDIGCGVGVDTIFSANMVGPLGKVVGIDLIADMLERAKSNLEMTNLENVIFIKETAEKLNFPDKSFDVVISNGVFNLIPDKAGAVAEAFRVLKADGRILIADQVLVGELQKDLKARVDTWFQ